MPIYEIHHSYPLTAQHKQSLATAITSLHSTLFTTPSFFVHVIFHAHDASTGDHFTAAKPRTTNTNRIVAQVRTSPARKRADFDGLAESIEKKWYEVLGEKDGGTDGKAEVSEREEEARRLLMVSFYPMVAAREAGMIIPEAGDEGSWFKEQMPYMKKMSEEKGLDDFTDMLRELEEREDLKKMVS